MGVALLGRALNKKIVSDRNSFINTFMKVCEQWHMFLKICRLPCINDCTMRAILFILTTSFLPYRSYNKFTGVWT